MTTSSIHRVSKSEQLAANALHERIFALMHEWCQRGRTIPEAAAILGQSYGYTYRRFSGEQQWELADFIAAACHQRDHEFRTDLFDALHNGAKGCERKGEPLSATSSLSDSIDSASVIIHEANLILKDGRADTKECAAFLPKLDKHLDECVEMRANVKAVAEGARL